MLVSTGPTAGADGVLASLLASDPELSDGVGAVLVDVSVVSVEVVDDSGDDAFSVDSVLVEVEVVVVVVFDEPLFVPPLAGASLSREVLAFFTASAIQLNCMSCGAS